MFPGVGGAVAALPPSTLTILLLGELTDKITASRVRGLAGVCLRVDRGAGEAGRGKKARGKGKVRVGEDAILSVGLNQLFCGPRPARPTLTGISGRPYLTLIPELRGNKHSWWTKA